MFCDHTVLFERIPCFLIFFVYTQSKEIALRGERLHVTLEGLHI